VILTLRLREIHTWCLTDTHYSHLASFFSTVDAFQGREACIVIYSCVRAGDKGSGIGFLSDVQRMNVALTRAQNFLFVIASLRSIIVNPYWKDLVDYAREKNAIISVPLNRQLGINNERIEKFPDLATNIKL
jgi:superfamily I DNA and/or RNA helicase